MKVLEDQLEKDKKKILNDFQQQKLKIEALVDMDEESKFKKLEELQSKNQLL